jgi:hypothetical protein
MVARDGSNEEAEVGNVMTRKLLITVTAMLVLAVVPAVAQAEAPHYYTRGFLIAEGEKVPVVEWGKLTLAPEPQVAAITTCEDLAGGFVENAPGGGPGIGATLRFTTYNCTNAECPASEVEIGGKQYEQEVAIVANPNHFPWPSVLEAPEPGVIRTNNSNVELKLACMAHGFSRNAAGEGNPSLGSNGAGESEQFVLPSGGPPPLTCVTDATRKQTPKNIKGTNSGPNQSKLVFDVRAAAPICAGGESEGIMKESLHIMGYKNSELITVR